MIDQAALTEAYEKDRFYALQLEINDACLQGCAYCYRNALPDGGRGPAPEMSTA